MWTHSFKLAWRRLAKDGASSAMSIVSLSLGVACASIVFLVVRHEQQRDQFHTNGDLIYKVYRQNAAGEASWERLSGGFHAEAGPMLEEAIPEVERLSRWRTYERPMVVYGEQSARRHAAYVDPTFLEMFTFPVLMGSEDALRQPHQAVITRAMAKKMVGEDELGSLLGVRLSLLSKDDHVTDVTIASIVETPPSNSSLQFDLLLPYDLAPEIPANRRAYEMETAVFLQLGRRADLEAVRRSLDVFRDGYYAKKMQEYRDSGRWTKAQHPINLKLLPLKDVSRVGMEGDHVIYIFPHMIVLLTVVAATVLVASCGNFATISIGRSMNRGREIGIRKVSGAQRWSLIRLSIAESILLSAFAVALGVVVAEALLPRFLALIPIPNLEISWSLDIPTLLFLFFFPIAVGVGAGLYPAFAITRLDTVRALHGEAKPGGRNRVGKTLVVIQFAASLFLLVSTYIIVQQFHYQQQADRGFDPAHVMTIQTTGSQDNVEATTARFLHMVGQMPSVVGVLATNDRVGSWAAIAKVPELSRPIYHYRSVGDFAATVGVKMVEGRQPVEGDPLQNVVINQTLAESLGWEDPIGQTLPFQLGQIERPVVVGVIEDFDFQEGRRPGGALVLHRDSSLRLRHILVRVRPENEPETFAALKDVWRQASPEGPHLFGVLDWRDRPMAGVYVMISSIGRVVSVFALLIACLGLVGLAMQTLARRKKEVGVRKVLGASIGSIFRQLSFGFLRLTLYGSVVGCLVSSFVMQKVIRASAYQMPITVDLFLLPVSGVVLVAVLSIGYHTLRTARTNPAVELSYQ